jgi:hypothetical protein
LTRADVDLKAIAFLDLRDRDEHCPLSQQGQQLREQAG